MASHADTGVLGLFWRADEIVWDPGSGNRNEFRLLGRKGTNRPTVQLADFREQVGIYILYGEYGPYYVGLTKKRGLGQRLKDHTQDDHAERWDRFSWFGFSSVLRRRTEGGLQELKPLKLTVGTPDDAITDIEALLIMAIGPQNANRMSFKRADEWFQVKLDEREHYLDKVR